MKLSAKPLFTMAVLLSCALYAQEGLRVVDAVAAEVGGQRITVAEVMERARRIVDSEKVPTTDSELKTFIQGAYSAALSNLIDRKLILIRYGQAEQKLPEWVFTRHIEPVIEEHFGGDRSQLVSMLAKRGISYDSWKKDIEEETIISAMRQQFVEQGITIRPDDVSKAYAGEYADKKLDGPVRLSMIMLERGDGQDISNVIASATALVGKLRGGTDFAAAARKFSGEQHAASGGDWGYIAPSESLRKELADAVNGLSVGAVSAPIVIADRYVYILKKTDEQKDLRIPLDAARKEIEAKLRRQMSEERLAAWLESLRKTTSIRVFRPAP